MKSTTLVQIESLEGRTIEEASADLARDLEIPAKEVEKREEIIKKIEELLDKDPRLSIDNEGKIQLNRLEIKQRIGEEVEDFDRMASPRFINETPPPAYDDLKISANPYELSPLPISPNGLTFAEKIKNALEGSISKKKASLLMENILTVINGRSPSEGKMYYQINEAIEATKEVSNSIKKVAKAALDPLTKRSVSYSEAEIILPPAYTQEASEEERKIILIMKTAFSPPKEKKLAKDLSKKENGLFSKIRNIINPPPKVSTLRRDAPGRGKLQNKRSKQPKSEGISNTQNSTPKRSISTFIEKREREEKQISIRL